LPSGSWCRVAKNDAILAVPLNESLIVGSSHSGVYGNETYLIHPYFRTFLRWQQWARQGDLRLLFGSVIPK
jgi:hypothetical protein